MLRSFSFAMALILFISGWSTAHAAPHSITPFRHWFTGWKPQNLSKLHRETPLQLGFLGTLDEIQLKALGWPSSFLTGVGACKYLSWPCDNSNQRTSQNSKDAK